MSSYYEDETKKELNYQELYTIGLSLYELLKDNIKSESINADLSINFKMSPDGLKQTVHNNDSGESESKDIDIIPLNNEEKDKKEEIKDVEASESELTNNKEEEENIVYNDDTIKDYSFENNTQEQQDEEDKLQKEQSQESNQNVDLEELTLKEPEEVQISDLIVDEENKNPDTDENSIKIDEYVQENIKHIKNYLNGEILGDTMNSKSLSLRKTILEQLNNSSINNIILNKKQLEEKNNMTNDQRTLKLNAYKPKRIKIVREQNEEIDVNGIKNKIDSLVKQKDQILLKIKNINQSISSGTNSNIDGLKAERIKAYDELDVINKKLIEVNNVNKESKVVRYTISEQDMGDIQKEIQIDIESSINKNVNKIVDDIQKEVIKQLAQKEENVNNNNIQGEIRDDVEDEELKPKENNIEEKEKDQEYTEDKDFKEEKEEPEKEEPEEDEPEEDEDLNKLRKYYEDEEKEEDEEQEDEEDQEEKEEETTKESFIDSGQMIIDESFMKLFDISFKGKKIVPTENVGKGVKMIVPTEKDMKELEF